MGVFRHNGFVYSFGDVRNMYGEYVVLQIDQSREDQPVGEIIDARIIKAKNPQQCMHYIKTYEWDQFTDFPIEQLPENKSFGVQNE